MSEAENSYASPETGKTSKPVLLRLSMMMFLQYFVQGCYLPIISVYLQDSLGFTATQVGYFGSALAVGPLVTPFILGQIVDRHMSTEHVLAFCHGAGGVIMATLYFQKAFWPVIILGTIYSTLYVPSMMLTNSLAFAHLKNRAGEFPIIRLFGTIGFVLPAWFVEYYYLAGKVGDELNASRGILLMIAGVAGVLMAGYSLSLPHTPPNRDAADVAPKRVVALIRFRHFLVLVLATLFIALVHKYFFVWNSPYLRAILDQGYASGHKWAQGAYEGRMSSLGQIFEVLVMAVLGVMLKRLGFKKTMVLGALAYSLRCVLFAIAVSIGQAFYAKLALVLVGQALHGACFGCFLAAAFIYVDRTTAADIRGSAQNIYGTFVVGAGFFVGGIFAGMIGDWFTTPLGVTPLRESFGFSGTTGMMEMTQAGQTMLRDWPGIWLTSAAIAGLTMIAFAIYFPREVPEPEEAAA